MKTNHIAVSQSKPTNQAPVVSSLPWDIGDSGTIYDANAYEVGYAYDFSYANVNGPFIVTACNSHAANLARIAELEKALEGAQKALRKALPYMADSDDSHYVGEWLDEVNAALKG